MKIDVEKLKSISREKKTNLSKLFCEAGVSRNAFYTLARRRNILPRTITAIADTLNVPASEFLDDVVSPTEKAARLCRQVAGISKRHRNVDPDNIRHTLQLLDEEPVERLRRALTRAKKYYFR